MDAKFEILLLDDEPIVCDRLQEFLEKNDVKKDFTEIQGFSNFLLQGILKKLHDLADEQGILPPPEMDEEKDNDDDNE